MLRIECIPYRNLDERFDLGRKLEVDLKKKKFKKLIDLGNCFCIVPNPIGSDIRY